MDPESLHECVAGLSEFLDGLLDTLLKLQEHDSSAFLCHDGVVQELGVVEMYVEISLLCRVCFDLSLEMVEQERDAVVGVIAVRPCFNVLACFVGDL